MILSIALRRGVKGSAGLEEVARGEWEVLAMGELEEQEEEEEGEGVSLGAPNIAPPVSSAGLRAVRMAEEARREGGRAASDGCEYARVTKVDTRVLVVSISHARSNFSKRCGMIVMVKYIRIRKH